MRCHERWSETPPGLGGRNAHSGNESILVKATYNNSAPVTGDEAYFLAKTMAQFVKDVSTLLVMNVIVGVVSLCTYAVISWAATVHESDTTRQ